MTMTLDKAIAHAHAVACGDGECANEHAQLASWLEELRDYRCDKMGGGKLTAEQVRDAIERHSAWVIGNNRCFHNGAYEAIADELNATLGNSKLTAEQVWRAVDPRSVCVPEEGDKEWQAIADELNAATGGEECELVYGENDHGDDGWWCQSCGGWFAASFRHTGRNNIIVPRYCQQCGKAVKR